MTNVHSKKESEFGYEKFIQKSFRGGGNRSEARVALNLADLDVKTISRKGDKFETEAISRHSERLAKESSDTNNLIQLQGIKINSTETAQVSCRISVLKLLLARNCHSYCCRRYEFRSSLPELATRPQFRNADLLLFYNLYNLSSYSLNVLSPTVY